MKKKLGQEIHNVPNQQWLVWSGGSFLQIQKKKKTKIHCREMSKN